MEMVERAPADGKPCEEPYHNGRARPRVGLETVTMTRKKGRIFRCDSLDGLLGLS